MALTDTLLLTRRDVAELLPIEECIIAVENVFKSYAEGNTAPPYVLGVHADKGDFILKQAYLINILLLRQMQTSLIIQNSLDFPLFKAL